MDIFVQPSSRNTSLVFIFSITEHLKKSTLLTILPGAEFSPLLFANTNDNEKNNPWALYFYLKTEAGCFLPMYTDEKKKPKII